MASILNVDKIRATGSTTDGLTIDSSGRVLTPARPAFRLTLGSVQSVSSTDQTIITFADQGASLNNFIQGGISVSSGRVTVPVAGVYSLSFVLRVDGIGSGYALARMLINGVNTGQAVTYVIDGGPSSSYENFTANGVYKLAANDVVDVRINASTDSSYNVNDKCEFSGFLVG